MTETQPPPISSASSAFLIALFCVALATAVCVASLAAQLAREEAYRHSPLVRDVIHCAEHHGRVSHWPSGEPFCRIVTL